MAVTAGKLDRIAQFRRFMEYDDGYGTVHIWADHGSPVPAARRDISDAEKLAGDMVLATVTARFTVRHTPFTADLTPADRLLCDGAEWSIEGIKEIPEPRRFWLELTATKRAA